MEFTYVVSNTVGKYIRHQRQASREVFPYWVTVLSLAAMMAMMAASTYGLFLIFDRVVENFIPAISGWTSIMAALLIAYNLSHII